MGGPPPIRQGLRIHKLTAPRISILTESRLIEDDCGDHSKPHKSLLRSTSGPDRWQSSFVLPATTCRTGTPFLLQTQAVFGSRSIVYGKITEHGHATPC